MFKTVLYEVEGPVARITLNRPDKHNAMNHQLWEDLAAAFDEAESDTEVKVVVLAGAGRSFCSGWDMSSSPYSYPPEADGNWTLGNSLITMRDIEAQYQRMWNFPKPTIARVHGYALAGGCYLQMLCDIAIADEEAQLGHPPTRSGPTSLPLWQMLLGPRMARYLLMTARPVSGREAERLGLVTMAVPASELDGTVATIAAECAEGDPGRHLLLKDCLNTALEIQGAGAMFRYHGQMNAWVRTLADWAPKGGITTAATAGGS